MPDLSTSTSLENNATDQLPAGRTQQIQRVPRGWYNAFRIHMKPWIIKDFYCGSILWIYESRSMTNRMINRHADTNHYYQLLSLKTYQSKIESYIVYLYFDPFHSPIWQESCQKMWECSMARDFSEGSTVQPLNNSMLVSPKNLSYLYWRCPSMGVPPNGWLIILIYKVL